LSYLRVDKKLCTGCRICETACSLAKERVINRAKSRIRVFRSDVLKLKIRVCLQCKRPACMAVCPVSAIYKHGDQVSVDEERCTGCGECVKVCDRLFMAPEEERVLMCDQCGACVPKCPEKALSIL
jgi:Fe-S-cluster-containing hydrogenase component 2